MLGRSEVLNGLAMIQTLPLLVFPILTITAALKDLTSFTIPNWLNLALMAAFFVAAPLLGAPLGLIGLNLAVGLGALAVGMGMFALGWIGGGDAKLFAAAALWLGLPAMPVFLIVTALAGGALAMLQMNARSPWVQPYLSGAPAWLARLATPGADVPYGVAIATGALAAFPQCALMHAFHGSF